MKKNESPPDGSDFLNYLRRIDDTLQQGAALLKAKRYDELIEICDKAIGQNTRDAEAWMLKGAALRRKRQYKEAFDCLDNSLKQSLMNWRALEEMAYLQLDINNIPQAIRAFEGTIQWQLTMLGTVHPHILFNMGTCYERTAQFEKAIEYFNKCIMAEPMNTTARLHIAMCQKLSGKVEEALQSFKRVLQLDPTSVIAQRESKFLAQDLEHKDLAIIKNQIFLRDDGSSTFKIPEDRETAEKILLPPDKMSEYKQAKMNLMLNHGVSMHELGGGIIQSRDEIISLDKAIEQSDIALSLVPDDLDVIFEKAKALLQLEKYREAIKHFDDSLKLEPNLTTYLQMSDNYYRNTDQREISKKVGLIWLYRARSLEKLGEYDEALKSYKKAKEFSDKLLPKIKTPETSHKPARTQPPEISLNFCGSCGKNLSENIQKSIRSKGKGFCPYCGKTIVVK
ncbi:MAG: tetratricopeptide repeat protein [Candidatus Hermodarchaeota archaeon]